MTKPPRQSGVKNGVHRTVRDSPINRTFGPAGEVSNDGAEEDATAEWLAGAMSCVFVSRVNARTLANRNAISKSILADADRIGAGIESMQTIAWECAADVLVDPDVGGILPL